MADRVAIEFAGEILHLLPDRALYWPAQRGLLIADVHLGKGDIFRDAGLAVPSGGTQHDLQRLDRLLHAHAPRTLYVLGDLLHGDDRGAHWRGHWQTWRATHAALRIVTIAGNHDRRLAGAGLALELAGTPLRLGPLLLSHEPLAGNGVICGHLHPVVRLPRVPGRQPAFVQSPTQLILPAFSRFTGGHEWTAQPGQQLFVCTGDQVIALPPGTPRPRSRR
jgi:DNA ligase-associated metallophosphoesterase